MENSKPPNSNIMRPKEIKIMLNKSKDSQQFFSTKSKNIDKNSSSTELGSFKNMNKNLDKKDELRPSQSCAELKTNPKEKKIIPKIQKKSGNLIKETKLYYINNKSKNKSLEKIPSFNINSNKKNNLNSNKNNKYKIKDAMEISKKNKNFPNKHHSCGKNTSNYSKYDKTTNNNNFKDSDKFKKSQMNKNNKIIKYKNEYNNKDNLKNININEEQSNLIKNENNKNYNYINYNIIDNNLKSDPNLITKSDLDDNEEEDDRFPFKRFKSVHVSINNNYNYNLSLGNNTDFIEQSFDNKKSNNFQIKNKEKENEWKEKINKINKQKINTNYDYRKLNNIENNFLKKNNELNMRKNEKTDEKKLMNKSSENNDNLKQKIKKLNSGINQGENKNKINIIEKKINDDKKNDNKKKMGILGFLKAFKDMMPPFNLRKKNNNNNFESNNNSLNTNNIEERLNKSDDNTPAIKEKMFKNKNFNTINITNINSNNNNISENNFIQKKYSFNLDNKKNILEKNNKIEDYNYYSDSSYDAFSIINKKNLYINHSPNLNFPKNQNTTNYQSNPQILSYKEKKNLLNTNYISDNENDWYGRIKSGSTSTLINQGYNNYKKEEYQKENNSLFNIYGIRNNRLYKKSITNENRNNNFMNDFNNNIPGSMNDINYNSAFIQKTKKKIFSPTQSNIRGNINYFNNNNNIDNNGKIITTFSFNNKNINNANNNNIIFNDINRENRKKPFDRHKLIEGYYKDGKYNSENIEENLNINAEKKIQEIKININYKKDNFNRNNINNDIRRPLNNEYKNNSFNGKKTFNNLEEFIPLPKPRAEIETCVINFKQNKKPIKVYENNLYRNINSQNNNYDNLNKEKINDNYLNNSNANIYDINNNSKTVYTKPKNKNLSLSQINCLSEKNFSKREKTLSLSDLSKNFDNKNFEEYNPIKKKLLINKEKKINILADSQEFDNDTYSISSQNSKDELNKTEVLSGSNITNSIYSKPFKSFFINNKNKNSNNSSNSFNSTFKYDNSFYSEGSLSEREYDNNIRLNKTNMNNKYPSNNNMVIYYNKNKIIDNLNLNKTQANINTNNNNQIVYTKKSNSSKTNNHIFDPLNNYNNNAINNITPMPINNNYNRINNNIKINNIKTIIMPKIAQKNLNFVKKLYCYYVKNPDIQHKLYVSREYIKALKLPLNNISFYTKFYYKLIQKPKIKPNFIDKRRIIKINKGICLPFSQRCYFTKNNIIFNMENKNIKNYINEEIDKQFMDENSLFILSQDFTDVDLKLDKNNDNKEENPIQLDKELDENIEILEFEKNNSQNKNYIMNDIDNNQNFQNEKINNNENENIFNNNNCYYTPNLKIEKDEESLSPRFGPNNEFNPNTSKSAQNKIISIEIQLNNKDKNIIKDSESKDKQQKMKEENNLNLTYNDVHLNTSETLYIKKKANNTNILNKNNNIKNYYNLTESDRFKTDIIQRQKEKENINNIHNFNINEFNTNDNINKSNNKIICIDIDLSKEQKKPLEEKEVKSYKKTLNLPPLNEPPNNIKNKINIIKINYNKNENNNKIRNRRYSNNSNFDKLKQDIIIKLDNISENNLSIIIDELIELLNKKIKFENNNNNNSNKIRLSFMEILDNENLFAEIIVNKVICDLKRIGIYAKVCYELSILLTNEINYKGSETDEDLKTFLQENCKLKFEELILNIKYIDYNDNKLLYIIMFICELINFSIIPLEIGFYCFEKLCNKYNESLYDSSNGYLNRNYYLDLIIEILFKLGRILYDINNLYYLEKIENYIENDLNKLINNDMGLPEYLRSKIINLVKCKKNQWIL